MINTVLTSIALLATTSLASIDYGTQGAGQPGSAIVINSCSYDVYLSNTPSDDGVAKTVTQTLSPGGSYSQTYTQLLNNNGWSLKLSKEADAYSSNILQYEYTYHPGEPIWFDLSEVNGNPWDGNWEITATGSCTPRQAAYRYATDDAYGMQSCPVDSSITVTLCSGDAGGAASQPAPAPSSPAETSWAPAPTSAPTSQAPAPSPSWAHTWGAAGKAVEAPAGDAPAGKDDAWDGPAVTVTNLHYATVTQYVTATANAKRHAHHPRHPHHRR